MSRRDKLIIGRHFNAGNRVTKNRIRPGGTECDVHRGPPARVAGVALTVQAINCLPIVLPPLRGVPGLAEKIMIL